MIISILILQEELEADVARSNQQELEDVTGAFQKKVRQLQKQLDQASDMLRDSDRVQEHCGELEKEVAQLRGQLNHKDTQVCQLELVSV